MAKSKSTRPKNDLALNIEARGHRESLLLWPKLWLRWKPAVQLRWKGKPFASGSRNSIPNGPGVYAFVIQPGVPTGIPHAIIMYVGKSDRPLRERFGEYLREKTHPTGRPAISTMLQMYEGYLHFFCATVKAPAKPSDVEDHLLEILAPPMNKQYPATIRRIVGAF